MQAKQQVILGCIHNSVSNKLKTLRKKVKKYSERIDIVLDIVLLQNYLMGSGIVTLKAKICRCRRTIWENVASALNE